MVGRLLAGVSTSLLYTTFEAWLVFEYLKDPARKKDRGGLEHIFSIAGFLNGIVAIAAGLVANLFGEHTWGCVFPRAVPCGARGQGRQSVCVCVCVCVCLCRTLCAALSAPFVPDSPK